MRFKFVVPAAGVGRRFDRAGSPKQYHDVLGRPLVCHTLRRLQSCNPSGIVVAVNPDDSVWRSLPVFSEPGIQVVEGGDTRAVSVLRCLQSQVNQLQLSDWVLVHDVARPCITRSDIQALLSSLRGHPVGGILGAPVADTLKRVIDGRRIQGTEDRRQFCVAMTPQMFRFGLLLDALTQALAFGDPPTDEAEAVERLGLVPEVVMGRRDNIKLTRPEDLAMIEAILSQQAEKEPSLRQQQQVQQ